MSQKTETVALVGGPFRLGDWLIEPSLNRISRGEESIQLELKWMDALVCLAERAGEVVSRIEIIDRVWATEFITDNTLTHTIAELRNALGDDAKKPAFIETIRQRGYRLIAPVKPAISEEQVKSRVAKFPAPVRPFPVDDERSPYPGLSAFTEADAEFFFGREAEVAQMWRRLTSRRLLAVIGPSGVGKSSFLRAGVIPERPDGWGVAICQPGESPFPALARALVPEFAGDIEAMAQLVDLHSGDRAVAVVSRWRARHRQALLVVDQFEELFTQNAEDEQRLFADLLGRLVTDWDLHVLLAMRDDFLYRCNLHEPLRPIFDALMPLEQPDAEALRRALVEPAERLGYTYEGKDLPGEMVAEVEGERGALPLLAFAVARLWDERDREQMLLTRRAFTGISGVGGALARHAETTLTAIGNERLPIVRELFRNLVTAEGTRAVRQWEELLSVFDNRNVGEGFIPSRQAAEDVLTRLIGARLLTSFEEEDVESDGRRRVEVVHESLLTSWPRLVRWQTQDADAAQLRDQLRQAARTWDEHDRARDYLWTERAYREFALWRGAYPGGLTDVEEDFANAMMSHNKRRKRRRRIAVAAAFVVLLAVLAVVGVSRQQAIAEANRAEAAKLLALSQMLLEKGPTEALAWATSSLELADSPEARVIAMRALWAAPPARFLPAELWAARIPSFSPDGRWLAAAGHHAEVMVWPETGGNPIRLPGHTVSGRGSNIALWSGNGYLVTGHFIEPDVRVWSIPEGRLVRTIELPPNTWWQVGKRHLFTQIGRKNAPSVGPTGVGPIKLRRWELPDGDLEEMGSVNLVSLGISESVFDPNGGRWAFVRGDTVYSRTLPLRDDDPGVVVARLDHDASCWVDDHDVWIEDKISGELSYWSPDHPSPDPLAVIPPPPGDGRYLVRDLLGRWSSVYGENAVGVAPELWHLEDPPGARTLELRREGGWANSWDMDVHPDGTWMATSLGNDMDNLVFYPLTKTYPVVLDVYREFFGGQMWFAFSPDGAWIAQPWGDGSRSLRLLPLRSTGHDDIRQLQAPIDRPKLWRLVVDSAGERLLRAGLGTDIWVVPVDGSTPRRLEGFSNNHDVVAAFSPSGRFVAAATLACTAEPKVMRIWDLETGAVRVFELEPPRHEGAETLGRMTGLEHGVNTLGFTDESTLLTAGANGVLSWDLVTGSFEVLVPTQPDEGASMFLSAVRGTMLTLTGPLSHPWEGSAVVHDLRTGTSRNLDLDPDCFASSFALDPAGEILAESCEDGSVRVGKIGDGVYHLLLGHEGPARVVHISPDGAWVASSGDDNTLRLWPMPDLSKPPLHTLPREELIAKLKTLTNLRVLRDEESATGWQLEVGPFPGWETVPEW